MPLDGNINERARILALDAVHAPNFEEALGMALSSNRLFLNQLEQIKEEYVSLTSEIDEKLAGQKSLKSHIALYPSFGEFYTTGFLSLFPKYYCPGHGEAIEEEELKILKNCDFTEGLLHSIRKRFKPMAPGAKPPVTPIPGAGLIAGATVDDLIGNADNSAMSWDIKQYDIFRLLISNLGLLAAKDREEAREYVIRSSYVYLQDLVDEWTTQKIDIQPKRLKLFAPHVLAIYLGINYVMNQLDILRLIDEIKTKRGLDFEPDQFTQHKGINPNKAHNYKLEEVKVSINGDQITIDFADITLPRKMTTLAYDGFEGLGNISLCILQHLASKFEGHCTLESFDFEKEISFVNNNEEIKAGCMTWGTRISFDTTLIVDK
jgi:hypothetical protein